MKTALTAGRFCIRHQCFRSLPRATPRCRYFHPNPSTRFIFPPSPVHSPVWKWRFVWKRNWDRSSAISAALLATLTPVALLDIAENGNGDDDTTGELEMLAASSEEAQKSVPEDANAIMRGLWHVYIFLERYVFEVAATGMRFLHLVAIFVPVIVTVPIIWFGRRIRDRDDERTGTLWWYEFLVSAMERAGPAFIKLGQWAASRSDIFPPELCALMSSLHSHAPAHSFHVTKRTIRKAFNGLPFEDIFEEFDMEPLGVGAIAQVYKAKLRPDLSALNERNIADKPIKLREKVRKNVDVLVKSTPQRVPSSYVAVKVLHPRVDRIVRRDLQIMMFFARVINAIPTMEWLSLPDEVQKFGEMMKLQLDLRIEASNLSLFREHFKSRTTAWFPYPYVEYTTREVLVEEFAQGIPLTTFLKNGGGVYDREISREGLDAFLHMLLIDNFVHADLHPGNIMVRFYKPGQLDLSIRGHQLAPSTRHDARPDAPEKVLSRLATWEGNPEAWTRELEKIDAEGYRPQIIFIDTGLVTQLNSANRRNFLDLFRAIAEFDGYKAGHLMVERSRQPDAVLNPEIFALKMQHLVLGVKGRTFALGNVKIGDVLSEVLYLVRAHHVRLEGDFVNVVISILLLEGIGRSLDPDLDLFKSALPILRQLGSGTTLLKSVREGDTSMLRVWMGLEARSFLQASISSVEWCVKYDQLSPNI
ncbi:mitochondrion protein [Coccidioides immitis H538.4]|uniref:Mitochondrion protein n=2 Tax=Coccidioides immitis TaxID=5501 RepID=A0A0J8S5G7_COCIT|nr:hypothetical protein CIRG_06494 [Coccidioides immitis RMSCC 2394]KMU91604.1 mitochondrion protein [Coccidioides immitis H538.4]